MRPNYAVLWQDNRLTDTREYPYYTDEHIERDSAEFGAETYGVNIEALADREVARDGRYFVQ